MKPLSIAEATEYIHKHHGITPTRQTVNNWTIIGRKNVMLRVGQEETRLTGKYTTKEWIIEFLRHYN